jgi:hypothetical protein
MPSPCCSFTTKSYSTDYWPVRFEDFTASTIKNVVLWDVTPRGSCKSRGFGKTPAGEQGWQPNRQIWIVFPDMLEPQNLTTWYVSKFSNRNGFILLCCIVFIDCKMFLIVSCSFLSIIRCNEEVFIGFCLAIAIVWFQKLSLQWPLQNIIRKNRPANFEASR